MAGIKEYYALNTQGNRLVRVPIQCNYIGTWSYIMLIVVL